ncbi:MAG TPA: SDR family NAD(P)-dependent oxidoreductase, partial [Longimicrobiales bacterium]|nr:SDR family NAD(P)-dependent oxidoreductase [Longimicrobiales bacterium]
TFAGTTDTRLEPRWLIVADCGSAAASRLARRLRADGRDVVVAERGGATRPGARSRFGIPRDGTGAEPLLERLAREPGVATGVIYFAPAWPSAAAREGGPAIPPAIDEWLEHATGSLLALLRALNTSTGASRPARLFIVTHGAHALNGDAAPDLAPAAALLGLGRVAAAELTGAQVRLVDLDPASGDLDALLVELATEDTQEEVAWRGSARFVPRLTQADDVARAAWPKTAIAVAGSDARTGRQDRDVPAAETPAFELVARQPGDLGSVEPREIERRAPGPNEIEVVVRYAALNFRDVLKALGAYPAVEPIDAALGDECVGVVRRVGRRVRRFAPGDEVVVIAPGCLRSHVTVPAAYACRLPPGLDAAAAATLPVATLTAYHSLHVVARLQRGETVLIHGAAGGVGIAAVQLALAAGARVFATAGSEAKRELLRRIGAELVMDSRSLDFADEVRQATGGRGVDVVLNSLAGKAMARSLELLSPGGRFIELGNRDFVENTRVPIRPLHGNRSYHSVFMAPILSQAGSARNLERLLRTAAAATGGVVPLPYRIEPVSRVTTAMRRMAQGGHVGKILLDMQQPVPVRPAARPLPVRPDGTYLITGAFGGVGLELCRRLMAAGARNFLLLGRRGPHTEHARLTVQNLRMAGARVIARAVDVSDAAALASVLVEADRELPPLAGVFHLAMVLEDATIPNIDHDRMRRVLAPKVHGAWHLHRLTADRPLDMFVLFGSSSGTLGNYGQGAYAAANAVLDAFAAHRRAAGLPATTMAWGILAEVGCIAENPALGDTAVRAGIGSISPDELWQALAAAVHSPAPNHVVLRADWSRLASLHRAAGRMPGMLEPVLARHEVGPRNTPSEGLIAAIAEARPEQRLTLARDYLRDRVARVLGASAQAVETDRPLVEMGLDSLMAVELMHTIDRELHVPVPIGAVSRDLTVDALAARLVQAVTGEALQDHDSGGPAAPADRPGGAHAGAGQPGDQAVAGTHPAAAADAAARERGEVAGTNGGSPAAWRALTTSPETTAGAAATVAELRTHTDGNGNGAATASPASRIEGSATTPAKHRTDDAADSVGSAWRDRAPSHPANGRARDSRARASAAGTAAAPRIVHLAGEEDAPLAYCFHPAGGSLLTYDSLAPALGVGCAVYGIESRLVAGAVEEFSSVAAMADTYADLISGHRPDRDGLTLVGYSFGALVALETARRLLGAGREVQLVALVECDPRPLPTERHASLLTAFLTSLIDELDRRPGVLPRGARAALLPALPEVCRKVLTPGADPGSILADWTREMGRLLPSSTWTAVKRYAFDVATHFRMYADTPPRFDVATPIVSWIATDGLWAGLDDDGAAVPNLVERHVLQTDHVGIMAPPHSTTIARRIVDRVTATVP